jgi:hypothetical protein
VFSIDEIRASLLTEGLEPIRHLDREYGKEARIHVKVEPVRFSDDDGGTSIVPELSLILEAPDEEVNGQPRVLSTIRLAPDTARELGQFLITYWTVTVMSINAADQEAADVERKLEDHRRIMGELWADKKAKF